MPEHAVREQAAPASPADLGGGVTVLALTDAGADHRQRLEETFPGMPAEGWSAVKQEYPETVGADGRWRLPINTFLVKIADLTLLVDSEVGGADTMAAEVFQVVGSLIDQLSQLGLAPDEPDALFFTHLHEDHVGGATDPATGEATFPHARYLVFEDEWEAKPLRRRHARGGSSNPCTRSSARDALSCSKPVRSWTESRWCRCRGTPLGTAGWW